MSEYRTDMNINENNDIPYISFTRLVKEEISVLELESINFKKALLSGFIKINANLTLRNTGWIINIRSENLKTAKLIISLIKEIYSVDPKILVSSKRFKKSQTDNKQILINIESRAKFILEDLGIYSSENGFYELPNYLIKNNDNIKYYLRGAFLASGSVNSPITKNYHLEISTEKENHANFLVKLFKKYFLNAKTIKRRNQIVVYLKKSDQIADFLKLIEANNSLFYFEDHRIQRDQLNSINRINNCEVSNIKKAMINGNKEADEIRWYKENIGFNKLNSKLKIIAQVRLASPDATYSELADDCFTSFNLVITKSGVYYRMQKLLEIINDIKGEEHG